MKVIPLTKGKVAWVDDEDFEWLNKWKWSALEVRKKSVKVGRTRFYAVRVTTKNGKQTMRFMHRDILNAPKGKLTDHIHGNSLDNQRHELRLASTRENACNARKRICDTTSKFKGVSWHKATKIWRAYITIKDKFISLGVFEDEVEAAKAYNRAAISAFGEYASLNPV